MFHPASSSPGRSSSAYGGFATPVRTPSTSYHNPYSQALTQSDASASKAVRFQNQPLPPQQQQSQQQAQSSSALTTSATPNKSPYSSALQTQQPPQERAVTTTTTPSTPSAQAMRPAVAPALSTAAVSNTSSSIALSRRIKWNLGALGLLWIVPALTSRPRDAYWAILDQIYMHVGGEADEIVDGVVGWIMWAVSVVLLFNVVEATVQMNRTTTQPPAPAPAAASKGPVLGMHSPQVAKSINFVAASRLKGSPKTRVSSIGAGSPISAGKKDSPGGGKGREDVDYSQFSPSLRRTGSPVGSSPTSGFGGRDRSSTPTAGGGVEYGVVGGGGSGSSPLAAFRARHSGVGTRGSPSPTSVRNRSVTPSVSNLSIGAGAGDVDLRFEQADDAGEGDFLGDESFEVDRALKSLRGSLGGVSSTPAPFR